jgi:hypothetical protein
MKLRSLWIGSYRNLQELEIVFSQSPRLPIYLAVGVNGTGKSGLLRVIVHIFNALEYDQAPHLPFRLQYQIALGSGDTWTSYEVRIEGDGSGATSGVKFLVTDKNGETTPRERGEWNTFLPAHIVVYTSGSLNEWQSIFQMIGAGRDRLEQDQTEALHRLQAQGIAEELIAGDVSDFGDKQD